MLDFLEHLNDEDAETILKLVNEKAAHAIIFSPIEDEYRPYTDGSREQQELQRHKSLWTKEKIEGFGYHCDVLKDFHTHPTNGKHFDAFIAWK